MRSYMKRNRKYIKLIGEILHDNRRCQPCERFAEKLIEAKIKFDRLLKFMSLIIKIFLLEPLQNALLWWEKFSVTRNVYKSRKQVMIRGLPAHVGMSLTCSVGPIAVDMTEKPKVASQFIRLSSIKEWMGESIKEIPISKQAINPFRIEGIINV